LVAEAPVIPWERRRQIGRIAAYWKTVFLVLRRNGRLGAHLAGRVNYRDAQKFRWLTIAHALALPVAGALVVLCCAVAGADVKPQTLALPLGSGLMWLCLPLMTGVVSWFFCPGGCDTERQNRSIALSYYTCAPLALWVFALVPLAVLAPLVDLLRHGRVPLLIFAAFHSLIDFWWFELVLFASHHVGGRRFNGVLATAFALPAAWFAVNAMVLGVLPVGAATLVLMLASLGP